MTTPSEKELRERACRKTHPREHRIWSGIKARCYIPSATNYHHYGGRGIQVCERWRASFQAFIDDMGRGGTDLEIDRIDNDGHYEPSNCRWVSRSQNTRNRRGNRVITYQGRTQTLIEWAFEVAPRVGVARRTIQSRIRNGWSPEDAFTRPWNDQTRIQKTFREQGGE